MYANTPIGWTVTGAAAQQRQMTVHQIGKPDALSKSPIKSQNKSNRDPAATLDAGQSLRLCDKLIHYLNHIKGNIIMGSTSAKHHARDGGIEKTAGSSGESSLSRRSALKGLFILVAGIGFLVRFLVPKVTDEKKVLRVRKDEIPENGALVFRKARVALMRESGDVRALSLVCTHLGCSVTVTTTELVCPCHGSVFTRQGEPVKGPATRPLTRLAILDNDEILEVRL